MSYYSLDDEKQAVEKVMKRLGLEPDENYFRTDRYVHPFFFYWPFSSWIIFNFAREWCYLIFTDDELIVLPLESGSDTIGDEVIRIVHSDVQDFKVKRALMSVHIRFSHAGESYYLYLDGYGVFDRGSDSYSPDHYQVIKSRDFYGLGKGDMS
ncbi:hypothetical protein [Dolosigranulum savutiense]|uniref:Uncharacterized protein n=1 Tax=Dolosigranulum savutiense TaxID=3110288 RepID=A0AB74TW42_9LACT